jgi:hypothetical protein
MQAESWFEIATKRAFLEKNATCSCNVIALKLYQSLLSFFHGLYVLYP